MAAFMGVAWSSHGGWCAAEPVEGDATEATQPGDRTTRLESGSLTPSPIPIPPGFADRPGPWSDGNDLSVWPNRSSHANSDAWLSEHHDSIRQMRPRLLLVNFSNEHTAEQIQQLATRLIDCLAESSRYQGYRRPQSPVFLQYEIFHSVDLRDADRMTGDSRLIPVKNPQASRGFNFRYAGLFEAVFARLVGVGAPEEPGRYLTLAELVERGYVHEVWLFGSGRVPEEPVIGAYEVVEEKPRYDEQFRRMGNEYVQAGNGGDRDQPWTGRSLRIGFVNASRGPGCFLESLAHGLEGNASSGSIPYFTKYFSEYAGMDWRERYQLPFDSLYDADLDQRPLRHTPDGALVIPHGNQELRIENYVPIGGNAHFPPNARQHYDLDNVEPVRARIETWRQRSEPSGDEERAEPWANYKFDKYRDLAPDCMGPWLIYWRQNMPGLDNQLTDDAGQPMKNWWPFLFY